MELIKQFERELERQREERSSRDEDIRSLSTADWAVGEIMIAAEEFFSSDS